MAGAAQAQTADSIATEQVQASAATEQVQAPAATEQVQAPAATQQVTAFAATEQVKARLISSHQQAEPGQTLRVGLQQLIIPHWHTYWLNPGDSGNATTIDWQLPAGASASDILWPTPGRTIVGPVTNYSYSDEVTLLTDIRLPADLTPGSRIEIAATVDWLVCEEECIPQTVQLALQLPVVAAGTAQAAPAADLAILAAAQARLPVGPPFAVSAEFSAAAEPSAASPVILRLANLPVAIDAIEDLYFYPANWGALAQSSPQSFTKQQRAQGTDILLHLPPGETPPSLAKPALSGVLVLKTKDEPQSAQRGYWLELQVAPAGQASHSEDTAASFWLAFLPALALAFGGGLILNLMPCVFPVLSIKALSLLQQQQFGASVQRRQGWVYTAGILVSFALLAAIILGFKAAGQQVGWGFQFQSPVFVLGIAYLLFVVGLSLSGLFEIGGSFSGVGQQLTEKPGYRGTFFTGVLATIVATPCTAPLMAAALGYALTQPPLPLLAIFLALGFGLAFPVLLLSYWPALQRALPKPGAWMDGLKQLLAFPIYAAVVWLIWVLALQQGADAVLIALSGLLLLAFAAWWYQQSRSATALARQSGSVGALLVLLAVLGVSYQQLDNTNTNDLSAGPSAAHSQAAQAQSSLPYQPYSDATLDSLLAQGKPVFVNFTAAWCISCLVNEKVALQSSAVQQTLQQQSITYLKADWTERDEQIRQTLARHGRSGVPLYLYYPAGSRTPVILPQILTPDLVVATFNKPGRSAAEPAP